MFFFVLEIGGLCIIYPPKTDMTMKSKRNEDVSPSKNGAFETPN